MNWLRCWFKITGHNIERAEYVITNANNNGERYGTGRSGYPHSFGYLPAVRAAMARNHR